MHVGEISLAKDCERTASRDHRLASTAYVFSRCCYGTCLVILTRVVLVISWNWRVFQIDCGFFLLLFLYLKRNIINFVFKKSARNVSNHTEANRNRYRRGLMFKMHLN